MIKLWVYIEGQGNFFSVSVEHSSTIDHLRKEISNWAPKTFARAGCDSVNIELLKVRCAIS